MGQAPPEGATHAYGKVSHQAGRSRQEPAERVGRHGYLEPRVAREHADHELVPILHDVAMSFDPADVDQRFGARQAEVHRGHEALTPRQDLGLS
jgi:hypothetical protein